MYRTTVQVGGMRCGMCEAHVSDAVRAAFDVRKVKSSRAKGATVIESDAPIDEARLREVITASGYDAGATSCEEVARRGLFGRR